MKNNLYYLRDFGFEMKGSVCQRAEEFQKFIDLLGTRAHKGDGRAATCSPSCAL